MSKVNLKDNIFIEGFSHKLSHIGANCFISEYDEYEIIYSGKTDEIPEDVAKECVFSIHNGFKNYYSGFNGLNYCDRATARESIQTACSEHFCIIYKTQ